MTTDRPDAVPGPDRAAHRLNLGDLAIVVGFAALFCVALRPLLQGTTDARWAFYTPYSFMRSNLAVADRPIEVGGLLLTDLSWMVVALRLRRPRPARTLLMRQPGWIACFAASIAVIGPTIYERVGDYVLIRQMSRNGMGEIPWQGTLISQHAVMVIGVAVAVSWVILVLGGQWRAEPSWIDRSGRAIGVGWLLLTAGMTAQDLVALAP